VGWRGEWTWNCGVDEEEAKGMGMDTESPVYLGAFSGCMKPVINAMGKPVSRSDAIRRSRG